MKLLIIGGVAAGTKVAAKFKRLDRSAEVTLITKDRDISYAGCGLPYYVGGAIAERSELIVNTPARFAALTGATVLTGREAVALNAQAQTVTATNLETGEQETYAYDACVITVGASAVVPPLPGVKLPGVFKMRTPDDATAMRSYVQDSTHSVKKAVVVGAGMIGLEAAENLQAQGLTVTLLDMAGQILPEALDEELAAYVQKHLQKKGINVLTATKLEQLEGEERVTAVKTSAGTLPADLVVMAVGVRPNTAFLQSSGLHMEKGLVVVDSELRTSLPHVYAAGDCVLVKNRMTGAPQWSAMGSSANYEGRTLAQVLAGQNKSYPGVLGTGIVKIPDLNVGRTGLSEKQAGEAGYAVISAVSVVNDKAHYYPDASTFIVKLVADRESHKLLGAQVLGSGAVDKMIDVAVTAISLGARLEDFDNMDLAYAPPFSTAIHPLVQAVYILENKLQGDLVSMTPAEYRAGKAEGYTVVDVDTVNGIVGAPRLSVATLNGPVAELDKDAKLLLVCNRGRGAYLAQNRLRSFGYTHTVVLEGGLAVNDVKGPGITSSVSPEDITRVKALGFLQDKNTKDCFNGRVITRNGKITAEETKAIVEAAERFGSGEIAMTSRLTIEIQKVPYANIEPLRSYLAQFGLETGGTGSKVRPVVSCKGTTCQYGLIDTFGLSEKIHERFYHGYAGVKLPHKFKIAVGGCPNNCVKPDLNDLGVIGQRVPQIDLDKCRGCKVCQVQNACPIHVAKVEDGKVVIDPAACNHCGRCLGKCPFHAIEQYTGGYKICIGGRWGKRVAQGRALEHIFTSEEEVMDVIEKAILLFREQGITGERFSDTIDRLGFENVQQQLMSNDLLQRKEENLAAQRHLKGGATC